MAFPNPNIGAFAWIALVPAFIAVAGTGFRKGFLLGEIFGAGFMASVIYWFKIFGIVPLIAGALFFGLFFALFWGLYGCFTKNKPVASSWTSYLLPPLLWMFLEWLRARGVLGFTWGLFGFTQYKFMSILQVASVAGVYGISFILVFVNNLIAESIRAFMEYADTTDLNLSKPHSIKSLFAGVFSLLRNILKSDTPYHTLRYAWIALLLLLPGILVLGRLSVPMQLKYDDYESIGKSPFEVGIVQVNMPQHIKWKRSNLEPTMKILAENTRFLAQKGAKIVVWPETAIPHAYPLNNPKLKEFIQWNARNNNVYLVTGLIDRDNKNAYNTVIMVDRWGQILEKYNKIHLVPLGEYLPLPEKYRKYFDKRIGKYKHGKEIKIFKTPMGNFQVLICFESMFSYLARRGVKKGAQFLVIQTNDAWFLKSNAAKAHFIMAIFRAVENRVWVVQSANTGVSGIVDPWGRVMNETEIYKRCVVEGKIFPMNTRTLYTRWGDLPAILAGIISLLILFVIPFFKYRAAKK
ncbi:MAG: apolipoprotein N-acyltransferase [Candidatus Eremiobacteraeota bacterium]|nr:apolipoprotein N-acyltransferase [Candidatus Eremiobacteraeota bacterium]